MIAAVEGLGLWELWTRPCLCETGRPARQLGHPCTLWPWELASVGGKIWKLGAGMEGGGPGVEGQARPRCPACLGILATAANFVLPGPARQASKAGIDQGRTASPVVLLVMNRVRGEGCFDCHQFQPRQSSLAAAARQATVPRVYLPMRRLASD